MDIDQFIAAHCQNNMDSLKGHCNAVITPDGNIFDATPSHVEWCIHYISQNIHIPRNKLISLACGSDDPLMWMVELFHLTCIRNNSILAYSSFQENEMVMHTVHTLKENNILNPDCNLTLTSFDSLYTYPEGKLSEEYHDISSDCIIFLDFDGVLNHAGCVAETDFLPDAITVVNILYYLYRAKIVISSSWRNAYTMRYLQLLLREKGCLCDVIDKTPMYTSNKVIEKVFLSELDSIVQEYSLDKEILTYIKIHNIQKYVILDDYLIHERQLSEHSIRTCWFDREKGGLRMERLPEIYKILGTP